MIVLLIAAIKHFAHSTEAMMEIVSLAHLLVTKSVAISGLLMTLTRMNVNWNVKVNLRFMHIYM